MTRPRTRTIQAKFTIEPAVAENIQDLVECAADTESPHIGLIASLEDNGYTSRRHVAYARGLLDAWILLSRHVAYARRILNNPKSIAGDGE